MTRMVQTTPDPIGEQSELGDRQRLKIEVGGDADSLDMVSIACAIEEALRVEIQDDDIDNGLMEIRLPDLTQAMRERIQDVLENVAADDGSRFSLTIKVIS